MGEPIGVHISSAGPSFPTESKSTVANFHNQPIAPNTLNGNKVRDVNTSSLKGMSPKPVSKVPAKSSSKAPTTASTSNPTPTLGKKSLPTKATAPTVNPRTSSLGKKTSSENINTPPKTASTHPEAEEAVTVRDSSENNEDYITNEEQLTNKLNTAIDKSETEAKGDSKLEKTASFLKEQWKSEKVKAVVFGVIAVLSLVVVVAAIVAIPFSGGATLPILAIALVASVILVQLSTAAAIEAWGKGQDTAKTDSAKSNDGSTQANSAQPNFGDAYQNLLNEEKKNARDENYKPSFQNFYAGPNVQAFLKSDQLNNLNDKAKEGLSNLVIKHNEIGTLQGKVDELDNERIGVRTRIAEKYKEELHEQREYIETLKSRLISAPNDDKNNIQDQINVLEDQLRQTEENTPGQQWRAVEDNYGPRINALKSEVTNKQDALNLQFKAFIQEFDSIEKLLPPSSQVNSAREGVLPPNVQPIANNPISAPNAQPIQNNPISAPNAQPIQNNPINMSSAKSDFTEKYDLIVLDYMRGLAKRAEANNKENFNFSPSFKEFYSDELKTFLNSDEFKSVAGNEVLEDFQKLQGEYESNQNFAESLQAEKETYRLKFEEIDELLRNSPSPENITEYTKQREETQVKYEAVEKRMNESLPREKALDKKFGAFIQKHPTLARSF